MKFIQPLSKNTRFAGIPNGGVDASLIGLCTPYGMYNHDHPAVKATIDQIGCDLHRKDGGVYRYLADTYYGGGEWVLLAGWLGWHYARSGNLEAASGLLRWIENQADENGYLPEQVSAHLLAPEYLTPWVNKWGAIANPLLWSHAMYLILFQSIYSQVPLSLKN